MAVEITMPQLSDTMSEGRILVWRKKVGEPVKRGEALAEVATDKADLEIESFHQGQLLKIFADEGSTVKVGSVIAVIGEAGEKVGEKVGEKAEEKIGEKITDNQREKPAVQIAEKSAVTLHTQQPAPASEAPRTSSANGSGSGVESSPRASVERTAERGDDRVKISPLAKNVATSRGVDYAQLQGSGEGGRIIKRDVESAIASGSTTRESRPSTRAPMESTVPPTSSTLTVGAEDLSRMRQTIAARMVESKTTIPHFYMTTKVVVDEMIKVRSTLKELPQYEGITYTHFLIKACALALRAFPRVNSAYVDGRLNQTGEVNIGIVTALPDGLLIPVLKRADEVHFADVVSEGRSLVQRARAGRPKADDLMGGTFSISNVGQSPIEHFSAIISPGQGAILAVSSMQEEAIVEGGQIRVGNVMRITLSVDHRIIDGVLAGDFLKEVRRLLENPVLLLA